MLLGYQYECICLVIVTRKIFIEFSPSFGYPPLSGNQHVKEFFQQLFPSHDFPVTGGKLKYKEQHKLYLPALKKKLGTFYRLSMQVPRI